MKTIVINIPDSLEMDDKEAKMLLASSLYEKGKLTLGQAADIVGLTKRTFLELLSHYGVSVFNYPASDLENDLLNVQSSNI